MDVIIIGNFKVKEIFSPSQAKMFKTLKEGDEIIIQSTVARVGSGRRGSYAPTLCITNSKTKESVYKSYNEFANVIEKFNLESIESTVAPKVTFDTPDTIQEAIHQRDLLLDVMIKILRKSRMLNHDTNPNGAEVYMHALTYLEDLK